MTKSLNRHYQQIVGGQIISYAPYTEDGDEYAQFCIRMPDSKVYWLVLSRDEEGNGPGFGIIENDD